MSRLALSFGPDQPELPVDAQGLDVVLRRSTDRHHISGGFLWHAGDATGRGRLIWSGIPGLFSSDCLDVLVRELAGVGICSVRVDLTPIMVADAAAEGDDEEIDDDETDMEVEPLQAPSLGRLDARAAAPDPQLSALQRVIDGEEFQAKIRSLNDAVQAFREREDRA